MLRQLLTCIFLTTITPNAFVSAETAPGKNQALHFDQTQTSFDNFHFNQDNPLIPKPSDFTLVNSAFLSNDRGERFALITLENTASGSRILHDKHIVATFVNGDQRFAKSISERVASGERITLTISFGFSKFPLAQLALAPR